MSRSSRRLVHCTLPPGRTSLAMRHRTVEEIWYVLEGAGEVWRCAVGAETDPVAVQPGDALVIPRGWRFQFRAGPRGPLRFLCYTAPPWPGPEEAVPAEPGGLGPATV